MCLWKNAIVVPDWVLPLELPLTNFGAATEPASEGSNGNGNGTDSGGGGGGGFSGGGASDAAGTPSMNMYRSSGQG